MPGQKVFTGRAGTAILFNSYGMHTAVENRTPVPRKSIILIYEKWSRERHNPQKFAAIAPLCATRARRKLFGLEV
jgi:ectoine hydroxylase-related dioxygenase (phytanoyl-CoA dioxygenase family)